MDDLYLWVKAGHVIAVISWMAGLLYLPRLFVYHSECAEGSDTARTFEIMERRLFKAIMTPAMVISWIFGLTLVFVLDAVSLATPNWFYAKICFVAGLTVFHGCLGKYMRQFAENKNQHSPRFYRLINEIPTVLMIGIVIFVIVRPF